MPVHISKEDIKIQVHVNLDYYKHATGPLSIAALRLAQLWATQLPEDMRKDIERAEGLDLAGF
jgi:hypothetical protein